MCTRPRSILVTSRTFGTSRYIDAPCGKCAECLKQRQNSWKLRICEEARNWKHLYFFTLTYREDTLPYNIDYETGEMLSTARKKHVQDWMKRLRERLNRDEYLKRFVDCFDATGRVRFKYFITAEYGPKPTGTKRPHYHGIILTDVPKFALYPSFIDWREDYGRIDFQEVRQCYDGDNIEASRSRVANYVSKYCAKGEFNSRLSDIEAGLIEPAWLVCSKNIGLSFIERCGSNYLSLVPSLVDISGDWCSEDFDKIYPRTKDYQFWKDIDNLLDNMKVYNGLDGFGYRMPRYYRERIFMTKKTFENPTSVKRFIDVIDEYGTNVRLTYYEKSVNKSVRYVAENFLSVAIAYRQRMRFEETLIERVRERLRRRKLLKSFFTEKSWFKFCNDTADIVLEIAREKENARLAREKTSYSQLCSFYSTNMFNNPEFD